MNISGVVVGGSGVGGTGVAVSATDVTVTGRLVGETARGKGMCVAWVVDLQAARAAANRTKKIMNFGVFMMSVLSQCNGYDELEIHIVPNCNPLFTVYVR
jgi:hypothetical protein